MPKNFARRTALIGVPVIIVAGLIAVAAPALNPVLDFVRPAASGPAPTRSAPPQPVQPEASTTSASDTTTPTAKPTPEPDRGLLHPRCDDVAYIQTWREDDEPEHVQHTRLSGELVDTGALAMASGPAELNAEGEIIAYTVQNGDTLRSIADRFCIDSITVGVYNDVPNWSDIYPGDRLVLRPPG